jgi:ABC-type transport system involved in multi-copper enzyme maturation permease subunit
MGQVNLLHYRPWRGEFREPIAGVWPIARVGLRMMFRYWPFWVIYGLGLMIFLLFFFGQYLLAWAASQLGESEVRVGGFGRADPHVLIELLRHFLKLDGNAETYRNYFWYQGYIVMVVLALAGSLLVGNDIRHGSMPFYLAKPISRWHYLLGKGLAVGVFINMMTTGPALLLFVQYGLLDSWSYFLDNGQLCLGILGYGLVLTVTFSLLLLATATWLKRTVPMIMTWATLFLFPRILGPLLVDGLGFDARWRLVDLWNNAYLIGNWCLGIDQETIRPYPQPEYWEAALVLALVWGVCLAYLLRRMSAVEIVK